MKNREQDKNFAGYPAKFLNQYTSTNDRRVPCNECNICCKHFNVTLGPDEVTRFHQKFLMYDTNLQTVRFRRLKDGSCINLIDGKCSIYEERPRICREYDCRAHFFLGLQSLQKPFKWTTEIKHDCDKIAIAAMILARNAFLEIIIENAQEKQQEEVDIETHPFAHAVMSAAPQFLSKAEEVIESEEIQGIFKALKVERENG